MVANLFPKVPIGPGVPAVARDNSNASMPSVAPATSDGISVTANTGNKWGIYTKAGALAIEADNVAGINYRGEYRLSDYPIEGGGFETYNKVALPFTVTARLTKGGSVADRRAFLQAIRSMLPSTTLYDVMTPERVYSNVNLISDPVERTAENGGGMIVTDLLFQEARIAAAPAFSQTQAPASAEPINNGPTQASAAPANSGTIR